MAIRKDYQSANDVRWCPGCGDYSVLATVQRVFAELSIKKENSVFVSGIGCSSRFPYYMNTYGMHSIHGRAPAVATGLKISRPDLDVWVVTGDGDSLSIGGNHTLHMLRRNINLNVLLLNNRIYGLTKGQYSPTSPQGTKAKSTPEGALDRALNPLSFAIGAGATFYARSIDSDANHLGDMIKEAYAHKGTSFVEIYQNCVVFNDNHFSYVSDKKTKSKSRILVEHGKPLLFDDGKKGVALNKETLTLSIIDLEKSPKLENNVLIHNEKDEIGIMGMLYASMDYPDFPVPFGVMRKIEKPSYEEQVAKQREDCIKAKGHGDLEKFLRSGDIWSI